VSEVVVENGKVSGVISGGCFEAFDKVVSTIPLPYVPKTIPGLPVEILRKFQSVKNIAVVCVIVKLRKSLTENFWLNVNDPDMDIPGLVEYTNLRSLDQHIIYVPFYVPGDHPKFQEPDEVFIEKVHRYLKMINPRLGNHDFIEMRASRYRYAQPICPPGYLDGLPAAALPIQGLWVADTSYYYPEDRGISESIGFGRKLAKQVDW
jgi:protoporphyrinogen oxidase